MTQALPLPEPSLIYTIERSQNFPKIEGLAYTADQLREYGAAREAAGRAAGAAEERKRLLPQWKGGNEFAPYHPSASHVEPAYRDGWNACYAAAIARSSEAKP